MFQNKTKTETKIRGRKPNRIVSFLQDCKRCDLALPFCRIRTIMCQPCLWRPGGYRVKLAQAPRNGGVGSRLKGVGKCRLYEAQACGELHRAMGK